MTRPPERSPQPAATVTGRSSAARVEPCAAPRIAFAGGGTGGHLVPGLHVLERLVEADRAPADLLWFGAGRPIEERVLADVPRRLPETTFERVPLDLEAAPGGAPDLWRLTRRTPPAVRAARRALRAHRSQVLLGLGGYTSLPAVLAARTLRLPVFLLEVNAVAGKATRWLAPLARRVFHAWPSSLPGAEAASDQPADSGTLRPARSPRAASHEYVGPPLPAAYWEAPPSEEEAAAARRAFGFDGAKPLLLVLGGSQGSRAINRFLGDNLSGIVSSGVQVLHQVGPGRRLEGVPNWPGYRFTEYIDDVPRALTAATIVLCRGGASTLAELAARGRPAFVVPYPHHADQHQERNARALGEGVAIVPESRLEPPLVRELVALATPLGAERRATMGAALRAALPRDAAERIGAALLGAAAGVPSPGR